MSDKLDNVHPVLANKARQIIQLAKDAGFTLVVTQGFRSFAEQNALYKKRPRVTRARGGQSYHNYGLAVDFGFLTNGKLDWTESLYAKIGEWAHDVGGLEWGGDWKHFKDKPHIQFRGMPSSAGHLMALINRQGKDAAEVLGKIWRQFDNV